MNFLLMRNKKSVNFTLTILRQKNISRAQVVAESLENEDDPFMQRLNLEEKLSALSDTAWEKDRELQKLLGRNPSSKYDHDNVKTQQKVADNSERLSQTTLMEHRQIYLEPMKILSLQWQ